MFLRLESEKVEHMVECAKYTIVRGNGPERVICWPEHQSDSGLLEFILNPEENKDWKRYWVMNNEGKTIDRGQVVFNN